MVTRLWNLQLSLLANLVTLSLFVTLCSSILRLCVLSGEKVECAVEGSVVCNSPSGVAGGEIGDDGCEWYPVEQAP